MAKKLILDCTSISSTYKSLERIIQKSKDDIDAVFNNFGLNQYSINNPNDIRKPGELLLELFSCQGCEINEPHEIYWFHATRVSQSEKFVDGIRPLHKQIEHI